MCYAASSRLHVRKRGVAAYQGECIVARIFLCHASEDKTQPHNPRTRHQRRIV
jgi:hypothetical protein